MTTISDRLKGVTTAVAWKAPCRVTTTANITLSGSQIIDGVTVAAGDRVLVRNQTDGSENGVYDVKSEAWTRAIDFDGEGDVVTGTQVLVTAGTVGAGIVYWVSTDADIVIGSTDIAFGHSTTDSALATVNVAAADVLTIEGGVKHSLGKRTYHVTENRASADPGLIVDDGAEIDVLNITVAPTVNDVDRFLKIEDNVRIGVINVTATSETGLPSESLDGFIQIRSTGVRIGQINLTKIDDNIEIFEARDVEIQSININGYVRGVSLDHSDDILIHSLWAKGVSANAQQASGNNGLKISNSRNIRVISCDVEDAPEHGVYVAGGDVDGLASEDIFFGSVTSKRAGQCGFKCKAATYATKNLRIGYLTVVDSTQGSSPGENEDGFRIENTIGASVGHLVVETDALTKCAYYGIFIDGVQKLTIMGGRISKISSNGIHFEDSRGPNKAITIRNMAFHDIAGDGIHVDRSNAADFADVHLISNFFSDLNGDCVVVTNDLAVATAPNYIMADYVNVAGSESSGAGLVDPNIHVVAHDRSQGQTGNLPSGGSTGQVLTKNSATSGDAGWATIPGGGDMLAATYDPANRAEQVLTTTDAALFAGASHTHTGANLASWLEGLSSGEKDAHSEAMGALYRAASFTQGYWLKAAGTGTGEVENVAGAPAPFAVDDDYFDGTANKIAGPAGMNTYNGFQQITVASNQIDVSGASKKGKYWAQFTADVTLQSASFSNLPNHGVELWAWNSDTNPHDFLFQGSEHATVQVPAQTVQKFRLIKDWSGGSTVDVGDTYGKS